MKERFPSIIALFLLGVLVFTTWWAVRYTQQTIVTDPPPRLTHEIDAWAHNFIMLRTDITGQPVSRLESEYGEHYPDDSSYTMINPRAIGLRPDTPITIATAKTGTMYDNGQRIILNQDAHIHRQPNADTPALDIFSEQITILPDESVIKTDLPTLVERGQSRLRGNGIQYDNKTRQLEVYAATRVDIAPDDTPPLNSLPTQTTEPPVFPPPQPLPAAAPEKK
jgi:lipopolysaccharide export system protein LptC